MVKDIDISRYAYTAPFTVDNNIDKVIASLEQAFNAYFNWLKNNHLKINVDKCQVLVSTKKPVGINTWDYKISNSECEKLLALKIDVNLNFNDHTSDLCKKASRTLSTLATVIRLMGLTKMRLLLNSFFTSQLSYYPPIWIWHSCSNNIKINMLHEIYLRVIYNYKQSSFTELLNKESSASTHLRKHSKALNWNT